MRQEIHLQKRKAQDSKIPPKLSPFWQPEVIEHHEHESPSSILWSERAKTCIDVIPDGLQTWLLNPNNPWSKSVISETLCRVKQGVMRQPELHKCGFSDWAGYSIVARAHFVRMKTGSQTAKLALDLAIG